MTELSKEQAEAMVKPLIERLGASISAFVPPSTLTDGILAFQAREDAVDYKYSISELSRFPFMNDILWSMPEQRALFIYAVELASQRVDELIAALPKAEG